MKNPVLIFLLINLVLGCTGASDPQPSGKYTTGTFVVNEGNFGESDGSISFINPEGQVENAIFSSNNNGKVLGDVVQSMYIASGKGLIVVNNSNKVEVVDLGTFESLYTLDDVLLPRYLVAHGTTGYVSEWVSFSDPGRVTKFDLETGQIMDREEVGFGAENMLIEGERLFVANTFGSTLSVIDLVDFSTTTSVEVGPSPGGMFTFNDALVVICGGGFDENFAPANNGRWTTVNLSSFEATFLELNLNVSTKIAFDPAGVGYYSAGNRVFKYDLVDGTTEPIIEDDAITGVYGLGFSGASLLYVADNNGFIANGEVLIYNQNGDLQNTVSVGRGPSGFLFVE